MSDRLHDHLTFGFRRGCVGCAQVQADLAICAREAERVRRVRTGGSVGPEAPPTGGSVGLPATTPRRRNS